jgi:50S ribosomal protein L16 3-hydroxylase
LLVRQAFPGFQSPFTPEELAGLACEEGVAGRILIEHGKTPWELRHGPFRERDFRRLPATHWTLLVTDMDRHRPELRAWMEPFRFIPDWRIDDLMVSYAAPGGSVGPHIDAYDVFLIQAHGRRRWQISERPVAPDNRIPGIDLDIMRRFRAEQTWVLEPGDMLYLPPNVAHYGVAQDDCMTWSVGFRAPAERDLVAAWMEDRLQHVDPCARYGDADLRPARHPGQIDDAAIRRLKDILNQALAGDDAALERWFGRFVTEPKTEDHDHEPVSARRVRSLLDGLVKGKPLHREPAARFAWRMVGDHLYFFADGVEYVLAPSLRPLAETLCAGFDYPAGQLSATLADAAGRELLAGLIRQGCLQPGGLLEY